MEIVNLLPILSGGLAGAIFTFFYSNWRTKKEAQSLIIAFCAEFVLLFDRCVIYLTQRVEEKKVSYSSLFNFTDASAFSKFASVARDPEIAAAIIELKAMYFQIQRHAEEASRYSVDANMGSHEGHGNEIIMVKAVNAQRRALAFFGHFYKDIERYTTLIIQEATRLMPTCHEMWKLSSKFSDAKNKYSELTRS